MQPEEVSSKGARPKHHVRPSVYLEDYDLTATRHRQVATPTMPHAAEESWRGGTSDAVRISPSPSDRASSPASQYSWRVIDEWSLAAFNGECSYEKQQVKVPSQFRAPMPSTILHGMDEGPAKLQTGPAPSSLTSSGNLKVQAKAFCPYCNKTDHYLSQCPTFKSFNKQQITDSIQTNHRCYRCGRAHQAAKRTLKKPCSICKGRHLQILHEVNSKHATEGSCLVNSSTETLYLDRPPGCRKVLLKVVRILLHHRDKTLDTYGVLDDGSERTILLSPAATKLGIYGPEESLALRTIRQDVQTVTGAAVSFQISPVTQPQKLYRISSAFTAERLRLAYRSYPLSILEKYQHLNNLPLQSFAGVRPLLLIGADNTHLITPYHLFI